MSQLIHQAARTLRRSPGFTAIAIATLALGIGANSAIFTLVNAVLFRPSQVQEPGQLVDIYTRDRENAYSTSSYADYVDLRDRSTAFTGVLHYRLNTMLLTREQGRLQLWTEVVSGNYFAVLGVTPALGRFFVPAEEDAPGAAPTVVLSHRFWQHQFGGRADILGQAIRLNGRPFTVIGVAAEDFTGMVRGMAASIWITAHAADPAGAQASPIADRGNRGGWNKARLRSGATAEQATTELRAIGRDLAQAWPVTNADVGFTVVASAEILVHPSVDGMLAVGGAVLLIVPGLVLLIACANLVTLVLARSAGRRRELAVRLALGATRGQLARQLLTEQMVLAGAGGVVGLFLSAWLVRLLLAFQPPLPIPMSLDLHLDGRVVGFTFLVTVLAGIAVGLGPALRGSRADLVTDLREGRGGGRRGSQVRRLLVAGQLALSMVLLLGAGLLVRGIASAARIDRGFDGGRTAVVSFDMDQLGVDPEQGAAFYRELEDRVTGVPGVVTVAWADQLPLTLNYQSTDVTAEGQDPGTTDGGTSMAVAWVSPDYFEAIGTGILAGRSFAESDRAETPRVAVVSQTAAARLWPGADPIGRRITRYGGSQQFEVVGIAADSKVMTLGEEPRPKVYFSTTQGYRGRLHLLVTVAGDPLAVLPELRRLVDALDPEVTFSDLTTVNDQVTIALFPLRFVAGLLSVLGAAGMLIAAIGLYGVIAEGVSQRTRELGIRLALGAERRQVAGLVLREGLIVAGAGSVVGLLLAAAGTRALSAWLYGVSATDAVTFLAVPLGFAVVAALACWIPARRATRVDPVVALRAE